MTRDSDRKDPDLPGPPAAGLRPGALALVGLGGSLGALSRHLLELAAPAGPAGWSALPWTTMAINIAGAFALGLLISWLAGRRPWLRLLLGTGFLGGFTTYSALAVDTVLLTGGPTGAAVAYALGTVVLGLAACVLGNAAGTSLAGARR